jgi:hypothetical protein
MLFFACSNSLCFVVTGFCYFLTLGKQTDNQTRMQREEEKGRKEDDDHIDDEHFFAFV